MDGLFKKKQQKSENSQIGPRILTVFWLLFREDAVTHGAILHTGVA